MKNLVLITQDFPPEIGGIHSYCHELGKRFARTCSSFTVIAPHIEGDEAFDRTLSYSVIRVRASNMLLGATLIPRLPLLLQELETDVILHAQWNTLIASAVARRVGYEGRIVCAAHGRELLLTPSSGPLRRLVNFYRKLMLKEPDLFVPVSSYTANLLRSMNVEDHKIRVIPNGTDPERFCPKSGGSALNLYGIPENAWVMLTTARLVKRKGVDVVIRALAELKSTYKDLYYLVVGTGEELENLKAMAVDFKVDDRVIFTGEVPYKELLHYYASADAFVMVPKTLTPDVEGFGIVYLEANACGLPVIGSSSGGVPDAIVHGETGLIVAENNADALKKAIITLYEDKEKAQLMGRKGRERVVHSYNWDALAVKMVAAVEGVPA